LYQTIHEKLLEKLLCSSAKSYIYLFATYLMALKVAKTLTLSFSSAKENCEDNTGN